MRTLSCLMLVASLTLACEEPSTPPQQKVSAPEPDATPERPATPSPRAPEEPKAPTEPKAPEPVKTPPEPRNPYETLQYKAPAKEIRGLLTLKDAKTIPWDEPIELVWNFSEPLRYEVHIQTHLYGLDMIHDEKSRNLLSFTPAQAAGAVMTYDQRKDKEPVIVETIDMYGERPAGDRSQYTDHLFSVMFPTSKTTLQPGTTLTRPMTAPFDLGTDLGTIRGKSHTKLLRAVRSGEETLLELRIDFTMSRLQGSKDILAMRGSRHQGEAIVYYAPETKRFVLGRLNTTSLVSYKGTDTAGLMAEIFGSEVIRQNAYYDYKTLKP